MEFRSPVAINETNAKHLDYLTSHLSDKEAGKAEFEELIKVLGNSIEGFPFWHPILTLATDSDEVSCSLQNIEMYKGVDHTVEFVRGFVTCPYSEVDADRLVESVNMHPDLDAYRLSTPLYSDDAFPVVVSALNLELDADGTIKSRDALYWYLKQLVKTAKNATVAEDWWSMRSYILGSPHGSRSSVLVNQYTGSNMRKILETLNNSGVFGPIKEWSLEMLSEKKRKAIGENLIRAALKNRDGKEQFEFEFRGETCKVECKDTWNDGSELYLRISIGKSDFSVYGFYYIKGDIVQSGQPNGKRALAEKFI